MSNTEREEVLSKARAAKAVAPQFAQLPTPRKNEILNRAAENLIVHTCLLYTSPSPRDRG